MSRFVILIGCLTADGARGLGFEEITPSASASAVFARGQNECRLRGGVSDSG